MATHLDQFPTGQSRLGSLVEALINILIGMGISLASQLILFPLFDIHIPLSANLGLVLWFTLISVARSYLIRRYFNSKIHKLASRFG